MYQLDAIRMLRSRKERSVACPLPSPDPLPTPPTLARHRAATGMIIMNLDWMTRYKHGWLEDLRGWLVALPRCRCRFDPGTLSR